ncbi:Eco57I restriction-modification methylase domain-containing protein [Jiella pacifica]|uniref:Eco57I restriction-modification methylase domain-containing protein n=1 Tax=Jiella pacifica TaxID=2696469 RepID=UPI0019403312|nr:SAM-dependent DNA methyltransferase [Jiella pacifica]
MQVDKYIPGNQKQNGAYYTPGDAVHALIRWAVRSENDRLLDPSCGDGRFIAAHTKSVGIEQDVLSAAVAMQRAPGALVHEGDFFTWAANTPERFECAAGNPPFIRYQLFKGETRRRALDLCAGLGAAFSGLSSSWPLFLVATASLLKPGGRMAFVVPAEIGHAPYSAPLLEYLVTNFQRVQIVAVRSKLFPNLSEDCWLLYTEGYGGKTASIEFTALDQFAYSERPPQPDSIIPVSAWRSLWNRRLRPFLLSDPARELYGSLVVASGTRRFGDIASIGIGYVSGANDFFHLRPSEVKRWRIPPAFLHPSVRTSRALPPSRLTHSVIARWKREDAPMLLLRLQKDEQIPNSVKDYLKSEAAREAQQAYKCRTRDPWYSVPDVKVPDFFLSYMSGRQVGFVRNDAGCTCTNTLHAVKIRDREALPALLAFQKSALFQMSCEIEGHSLGGGMLKLEPGEASRIILPTPETIRKVDPVLVTEAVTTLQEWRHYAA